jgi:type III secretion protein U
MAKSDQGEKKHPPTPYKLQQLRQREGQIARSRDFPAAVSLVVTMLYILMAWRTNTDLLTRLFVHHSFAATSAFGDAAVPALVQSLQLLIQLALPVAGFAIFSYILASLIDSRGLLVSFKHVTPQMERLNPATNLKNIIGLQALTQLAKTLTKAILFIATVLFVMWYGLNAVFWAPVCGGACVKDISIKAIVAVIIAALVIILIMAIVDIFISRALFRHEQRMTDGERKQEQKQQFGAPEMRSERRRLRREAAQSGYRGFGRATLLIESPEGAIAIAYKPGEIDTPVVVGKVTGEAYRSIRFEAEGKGVPIIRDDDLVQSLGKLGRVGEAIPTALFMPVATILTKVGLVR